MCSYNIKCIVVGDGAVGKDRFPDEYVPTVMDDYSATIIWKDTHVTIALWDTNGQEDYDKLRPLGYPGTDIFIVAFSVDDKKSFENVTSKWVKEIKEFSITVPIVLVGTKTDTRKEGKEGKCVTTKMGEVLAKEIGAVGYYECSAKERVGLKEVFELGCVTPVIKTKEKPNRPNSQACGCIIS